MIGATKIHQLQDNLAAADLRLEVEDIQALDDLTASAFPYPLWMQDMGWDQKVKDALGKNEKSQEVFT